MPYQENPPLACSRQSMRTRALSTCFQMFRNKPLPIGLCYLFSCSQRLIAFCRQVNRVAFGFCLRSYSISRSTTDRSPPTLRSRSSNRDASLNAPVNNSSAICGSPRIFRISDSTHSANLLLGRTFAGSLGSGN